MKIVTKLHILAALISFLSGCATTGGNVLPIKEEMTTPEIYKMVMQDNKGFSYASNAISHDHERHLLNSSYSKNTKLNIARLNKKFKTLPNPQIPVYVFPHYAKAGGELIPVSGYTTVFHLYKNNQFALIGERYS